MALETKVLAAFTGNELIIRGAMAEVIARCKSWACEGRDERLAIFEDDTGRIVDIDFSGTQEQVLARLSPDDAGRESTGQATRKRRGPGRPKLGIVCREVSLLPRHWQWLAEQRGGASATLRRLVEGAKKSESHEVIARRAIDAAHRFMWDIAGNEPGFEEATRALFAMDFDLFEQRTSDWPVDIRRQLARYIDKARVGNNPA